MKTCPQCGEAKPVTDFGRNRALRDGLSFYCLSCNRERNRRWYRDSRRRQGREVRDHSWVPEGFRWCPSCHQAVAHEDFARSARTSSGFGSQCKPCKYAADMDRYYARRYGLDRAGIDELRARQSDLCAICGDPRPAHIDHDHERDFVRALLCERCNLALGLFRDDPSLMRAAADYVELHRLRHARSLGDSDPDDAVLRRLLGGAGPVAPGG
ncbi:recombination endonuclease VII [Geodermatophilus tzadiensis]|uniref:Recombination endonuclease VII n=1 Tax=Geodermatophilus tzadiensis TaxID=1137988 RepID=A0A2T0TPK5_9ACTN|nr:endonuclease domain-containing protein [Geodermatophilus tzadiensis]PRY47559.1 recombination endonuclease VII [Geodermatophilus tzadiensis]